MSINSFQADVDKYTDITVSIRHDIAVLGKFIAEKEKPVSLRVVILFLLLCFTIFLLSAWLNGSVLHRCVIITFEQLIKRETQWKDLVPWMILYQKLKKLLLKSPGLRSILLAKISRININHDGD